jgi:hypothetical protein
VVFGRAPWLRLICGGWTEGAVRGYSMCRGCAIWWLFLRGGASVGILLLSQGTHDGRSERREPLLGLVGCNGLGRLLRRPSLVLRRCHAEESRIALVGASAELFGGKALAEERLHSLPPLPLPYSIYRGSRHASERVHRALHQAVRLHPLCGPAPRAAIPRTLH